MSITFIASATADNGGVGTATLTVPTGVTTTHLGILVVADQNSVSGTQTISGWTNRDMNSAGANNTSASVYIWSRLGGLVAGNTINITLGTASNATTSAVWYDTQGRDITNTSAAWNNGGADIGTVTFNAPGHTGTRDVIMALGHRTSGTVTFGALSPAGPVIDYQTKSATYNDGALFAHANAVTSQSYTTTLASSVVGHNFTTRQFALAAPAGGNAKVWTGAAWAAKPVKVWSGTAWVTKPVKFWNGTAWQTTSS
jgi:hypothetical protein